MTKSTHIALFHVHKDAMASAVSAFTNEWPEAEITNLLEDGLFNWVRETGHVVPDMHQAFVSLTEYLVERGAEGILYSCSAFGECIDTCIEKFDIPLLRPNDAMIEEAIEIGSNIAVLATVGATIPTISEEINQIATGKNVAVRIFPHVIEGAFDALASGNGELHDELVSEQAAKINNCDVMILSQFTLSRATNVVSNLVDVPVLNSPSSAIKKLRKMIG
tara:strand:+ start:1108 stop:1767 length:660 start_codon:yes stop_codon:yes gene_type:complete